MQLRVNLTWWYTCRWRFRCCYWRFHLDLLFYLLRWFDHFCMEEYVTLWMGLPTLLLCAPVITLMHRKWPITQIYWAEIMSQTICQSSSMKTEKLDLDLDERGWGDRYPFLFIWIFICILELLFCFQFWWTVYLNSIHFFCISSFLLSTKMNFVRVKFKGMKTII